MLSGLSLTTVLAEEYCLQVLACSRLSIHEAVLARLSLSYLISLSSPGPLLQLSINNFYFPFLIA